MSTLPSTENGKKRVGDIFKVLGGGTPTTTNPQFWAGTIPWATSADLDDDFRVNIRKKISRKAIEASATNLVPAGSVVVATRVGLGKVGIAETDLCFSQDCQGLIVDKAVCDSKFVAHQLKLRVQVFKHISRGTTIAGVTKKQLLDVPFDRPPLPEQKRIVAEIEKQFTRLESGVGALKRVQANLNRYRAAVLKAACEGKLVTTEAVLARKAETGNLKPEGKSRCYEAGEELLKRILAERREKWAGRGKYKEPAAPDTTNLPKLPDGWVWASLDQVCSKITDGTHHSPKNYAEGEVAYITSKNVREFRLDLSNVTYIDRATHDEIYARCDVQLNDVLYVKDGANTGLAAKNTIKEPFSLLSSVGVLRTIPLVAPDYLVAYLNSKATRDRMLSQIAGVAITRLTLSKLAIATVAVPPLAEQKRIMAEVERRLSVVDELETIVAANLKRSTRLRQSILQKAFEGRLV